MTKVIDFDAFRAEQNAEPIVIRIGGNEYSLPSSLPAALALDIIRMNALDGSSDVKPEQLEVIGTALFGGGDTFSKVVRENGITMTELTELIKRVFAAYNGASEDPNPESPPAPAKKRAATSR